MTAAKDVATEKTHTLAAGDEDGYHFSIKNPYDDVKASIKVAITNGAAAKAYLVTESGSTEITAEGILIDVAQFAKIKLLATDLTDATEVAMSITFTPEAGTQYNPIDLGTATSYDNIVGGKYYKLTNTGKTYNFDFKNVTATDYSTVRMIVNGGEAATMTTLTLDATTVPTIIFKVVGDGIASFATEVAVGSEANPATFTIKNTKWDTTNVLTYYFVYNAQTAGTLGITRGASSSSIFRLTVIRKSDGTVVSGPTDVKTTQKQNITLEC